METTWGGSSLPGNLPVLVTMGSTEAMQALQELCPAVREPPPDAPSPRRPQVAGNSGGI